MADTPLTRSALWFLGQLVERYKRGITIYDQPIGVNPSNITARRAPFGVGVNETVLTELQRQGYAETFGNNLWRATENGVQVYEKLSKIYSTR